MDLPVLTKVSDLVLREYNATRFKWRFSDGKACFEAFYSSDPLEHDGHGILSAIDGRLRSGWFHGRSVLGARLSGTQGPWYGNAIRRPLSWTRYGESHAHSRYRGASCGGNRWSARKFLDHVQSSSAGISSHWSSHRIRTALDLPAAYRKDVEESDKVYWCGWRQNPPGKHQSEANYQKTLRWLGGEIAELCRSMNVSTRWSADPDAARTDFPLTLADFRKHGLTHGWPSRIS